MIIDGWVEQQKYDPTTQQLGVFWAQKKIKFLRSKIIPLSQWYNQVESWRLKFGNPNIHLRSRIVRSSQDQHNMGIHLFLYHKCFDLMKSRIFPSKNGKHGLTQTPNHPCREKEGKKKAKTVLFCTCKLFRGENVTELQQPKC